MGNYINKGVLPAVGKVPCLQGSSTLEREKSVFMNVFGRSREMASAIQEAPQGEPLGGWRRAGESRMHRPSREFRSRASP